MPNGLIVTAVGWQPFEYETQIIKVASKLVVGRVVIKIFHEWAALLPNKLLVD